LARTVQPLPTAVAVPAAAQFSIGRRTSFDLLPYQEFLVKQNMNKITLAPRYSLRIEDFGDQHALAVRCEHCGHEGRVGAELLRAKAAPYARIVQVIEQLRCRRCGNRSAIAWWTVALEG